MCLGTTQDGAEVGPVSASVGQTHGGLWACSFKTRLYLHGPVASPSPRCHSPSVLGPLSAHLPSSRGPALREAPVVTPLCSRTSPDA